MKKTLIALAILLVFTLGTVFSAEAQQRRLPPDPVPYTNVKPSPPQKSVEPRRDFEIFRVPEKAYPPDGLDRFRLKGNIEAAKVDLEKHGGQLVEIDERLTGKLKAAGEPGQVWKVRRVK